VTVALKEMSRVVYALILREIKTCFGTLSLGYLWAFIEPILMIAVFYIMFTYRDTFKTLGMTLILFLVTGMVPYFLFCHIMSVGISALRQNRQLLTYPQVHITDIIFLARYFLEIATSTAVFLIFIAAIVLFYIEPVAIDFPFGLIYGFFIVSLLGLGMGMILGAIFPIIPSIEPMSESVFGRPLSFFSETFFSTEIRDYLLYNPLFHGIELIRSSFFITFESSYFDYKYTLELTILLLFLAL